MTEAQKQNARRIRRELAAELSKKKPDPIIIEQLREEIMKNGGRCIGRGSTY